MRPGSKLLRVAVAVCLVAVTACTGDGGDDAALPTDDEPVGTITLPPTSVETGGIEVDASSGTSPIAIPALGFGVAVPERWQATTLSEVAIERLEAAELEDPFFADAAKAVRATGAIFYAAGVDDQQVVSELKIDRQDNVDTSIDALVAMAETVAANLDNTEVSVEEGQSGERARVDFAMEAASAETGEPIQALGTQLFVPAGTTAFSLIITSENRSTLDMLVELFSSTFVVAES